MELYEKDWVRLPLEKAYNVRELGGYPAAGGQTAYHRFLRADDISALTDRDVDFLLGYGVRTVLDLRSIGEVERRPDRLAGLPSIEHIHIPFLGEEVADATALDYNTQIVDLGTLYLELLDKKETVKKLFAAIAAAPEGCILFHCSAGKDRTGVLAMLLLSLAGVDKQDCMTNYGQSYPNLTRNMELLSATVAGHSELYKLMYSLPESIAPCYEKLEREWGGPEGYLAACGLSPQEIDRVKNRLLA